MQPVFLIKVTNNKCQINTNAICKARVPSTLARSYLVMYGVVVRLSSSTLCGPVDCSVAGRTSTASRSSSYKKQVMIICMLLISKPMKAKAKEFMTDRAQTSVISIIEIEIN